MRHNPALGTIIPDDSDGAVDIPRRNVWSGTVIRMTVRAALCREGFSGFQGQTNHQHYVPYQQFLRLVFLGPKLAKLRYADFDNRDRSLYAAPRTGASLD